MKNKEKDKKPIFKKWWFWLIIVIVFVVAISAGGGSDEQTTGAADNQTTQQVQENQTEGQTDETSEAEEATKAEETTVVEETTAEPSKYDNMENVYFVGDTLEYDNIEIKYVSAENWKGYDSYFAPKSGNKIIRLKFEIKNNGGTDLFISSYDFNCYADDTAAEAYYMADDDLSATVSSGRSASGYVYFEVPKDAEYTEVEYETNFWTSKKAIFVVE